MIFLHLFGRFAMISLLAFGGGAGLPLIERVAVHEARWIDAAGFSTAVAFSYAMPGPMMIVATFVGYRVAGVGGALAASVGAFLGPCAMSATVARHLRWLARDERLRGFGRGARP